jgi:IS30 family transposase
MNMAGFKQAEIARRLKRSPGTISRELKRNRDAFGHYHYESAQRIAEQRRG